MISNYDPTLESKWAPVLEGINSDYTKKVTRSSIWVMTVLRVVQRQKQYSVVTT
mgnify:CR=1 FL=1